MKSTLTLYLFLLLILQTSVSCRKGEHVLPDSEAKSDRGTTLADPLPSWNDGDTKDAILQYVASVTEPRSSDFIPEEDRIAVFDNDGTLWSEQPAYFQLFFAMDRVKELAGDHPEWKTKQPFKAVLENDMGALLESGEKGLMQIVMETHAGTTTEEFEQVVQRWIGSSQHPVKKVSYDLLVYQPMLELLSYLRANGFQTYIVSGGGIEFMRAIVTQVYGIPKQQIIGSSIKTQFEYNDGDPVIRRLPELDFFDDKEGKPVAINHFIGKKPVFAAGNSDGDLAMLQWTHSNKRKSFKLYVHHTDSVREWAYDRESHIGKLDKGLEEAAQKGWSVADMSKDWKVIYPFELN